MDLGQMVILFIFIWIAFGMGRSSVRKKVVQVIILKEENNEKIKTKYQVGADITLSSIEALIDDEGKIVGDDK